MRPFIFICGGTIIAMGVSAMKLLPPDTATGFLQGALTLGGGMIICGLFSIRMPWHGLIGAGILALLGAGRGIGNLPGVLEFFQGNRSHGSLPIFELGVMAICTLLVLRVIRALRRERLRRMLEQE